MHLLLKTDFSFYQLKEIGRDRLRKYINAPSKKGHEHQVKEDRVGNQFSELGKAPLREKLRASREGNQYVEIEIKYKAGFELKLLQHYSLRKSNEGPFGNVA